MKKGIHPQLQWISYVTQSGRVVQALMTRLNRTGKAYHLQAKRHKVQSLGAVAKFRARYGGGEEEKSK